jgi:DHA2 family multidrug resistance protein
MGPIPKEQMGNATSLFNLMRNLGGSVGIAMATTLIARHTQVHINYLGQHVNRYNPQAQQMIQGMSGMFRSQGSGPVDAGKQGYMAIWGMVQQQAAILSYIDVFVIFAVLFACVLPLVFFMKKPPTTSGPVAMH